MELPQHNADSIPADSAEAGAAPPPSSVQVQVAWYQFQATLTLGDLVAVDAAWRHFVALCAADRRGDPALDLPGAPGRAAPPPEPNPDSRDHEGAIPFNVRPRPGA